MVYQVMLWKQLWLLVFVVLYVLFGLTNSYYLRYLGDKGMKSLITMTDKNSHFQTYKFDTIFGEARIERSNWRGYFTLFLIKQGTVRDENFETIYFLNKDDAYIKLCQMCDDEVERVTKYIKEI